MLKNLAYSFRYLLVPHHTNNFKAKALHHPSLLFYIFLLFVFQTFYIFVKRVNPDILGFATDISVEKLLTLVNQEREKANLKPLLFNESLAQAAENKGADMFDKNYWAHISPTGTTPWEFITKSGYQYIYAGENLAKSFDKSDDVVTAWMKSPTHRANILKPEYTEIGLAIRNGNLNGEETTLVVQEFGSRLQPEIALKEIDATKNVQQEVIAGKREVIEDKPAKSNFRINRSISLGVAEFMLVVLLIDSIFIWKNKTVRISGHSLAHIMFLLALLGAMSATGIGAIL